MNMVSKIVNTIIVADLDNFNDAMTAYFQFHPSENKIPFTKEDKIFLNLYDASMVTISCYYVIGIYKDENYYQIELAPMDDDKENIVVCTSYRDSIDHIAGELAILLNRVQDKIKERETENLAHKQAEEIYYFLRKNVSK